MATRDFGALKNGIEFADGASPDNGETNRESTRSPRQLHTPVRMDTLRSCDGPPPEEISRQVFPFLDPALEPGELGWFGVYRVVKLLGEGGMGIVFLAEDPRLKRPVALKVMRPDLVESETARKRFLREARATAVIRSEHIVAIYEIGQSKEYPFLVTELLHGKPLNAWLNEVPHPTPAQIVDLGLQIARGLDACHRAGVIHRDLKPANLWREEPTGRIKILDFGLARFGDDKVELTQAGTLLGTPAYMAPEQAEGNLVDARCDLFSLGCILYEAATGRRPFDGPTPVAIIRAMVVSEPAPLAECNPDLPPKLSALVMRLLHKDREKRPPSAAAVIEALEEIAGTRSSNPAPAAANWQVAPRLPIWMAKRRRRIAILAAVVGLVALGSYSIYWFAGSPRAEGAGEASVTQTTDLPARSANVRGVSDTEILLGMSAPFSGPARELGREMEVGIRTYFDHVNDNGGVRGRKLKLLVLDDGYEPVRALANMKELYEQRRVFAVIGNVGTPTAEKTMPYALSKQMIFFGAYTGARLLRRVPPDRYVFNYRASYSEETAALVKYLVEIKEIPPDQIAVFAQEDSYGDAGFKGVATGLRKYGRRPEGILRVGHPRNSAEVGDAVQEILRHKQLRAVVLVSTYRPAARFIQLLKDAKRDLVFANVSFVGSDALAEELMQDGPEYAAGVIVSQVVPHPASQSTAVLKYRRLLRKYYPEEQPSFGSLEGYINAAILVDGLRHAGDDLSTEKLVDSLEAIGSLDLGLGTTLHYGPSEHQASHKVWGTILDRSGRYQILDLE